MTLVLAYPRVLISSSNDFVLAVSYCELGSLYTMFAHTRNVCFCHVSCVILYVYIYYVYYSIAFMTFNNNYIYSSLFITS